MQYLDQNCNMQIMHYQSHLLEGFPRPQDILPTGNGPGVNGAEGFEPDLDTAGKSSSLEAELGAFASAVASVVATAPVFSLFPFSEDLPSLVAAADLPSSIALVSALLAEDVTAGLKHQLPGFVGQS